MNQVIRKITSIIIAFIVLFSTFSFKVESHYCGGYLIDISVFSSLESCGMEKMPESTRKFQPVKNSCCKNVTIYVEGKTVVQQEVQKLNLPQVYFEASFTTSSLERNSSQFNYLYKPPLVKKDFTLLFENFRI